MLTVLKMIDKIKPRMMTFADAGRALGNNQIDAFCQSSAPAAAVKELAETKGVYILPYSDSEMDAISAMYPFYTKGMLKEGTYKGVPPTQMPFLTVYWVAHERVSEKAVQEILELVYQPKIHEELTSGHKAWGQMAPDTANFIKLGAPMHPGAVKYYKSKGLWKE